MSLVLALALLAAGLAFALWVVFARQLALVVTTLFVLACAPTLQIPVVHVAVIMPLALMCLAARFTGRWGYRPAAGWAELGAAALVLASLFALLAGRLNGASLRDFVPWAVMTLLVVPLCALPGPELLRAGRAYAWGAGLGAAFGLALRLGNPSGSLLPKLSFLGYSATGDNGRYVVDTGAIGALRLTGAYLDPNLAGLMLTVGLVFAAALLRGVRRAVVCVLALAAIALTFSRAAIGSVAVAALLYALVARLPSRTRQGFVTALLLATAGLVAVPGVRTRPTSSFGEHDTGSAARGAALRAFPSQMSGHWLLGRGFGYPPLVDGPVSALHVTQIPANAPLLTAYRGGVVAGLVFLFLLVVAAVHAARLLRHGPPWAAMIGAGTLALFLIALQLDIPVVTLAPAIAVYSVCLAFLARADALTGAGRHTTTTRPQVVRASV